MPRRRQQKKRAPRRQRKTRVPRSLAMKPYNYVFKLPAQIQTSSGTAGLLNFSGSGNAGQFPLTNNPANLQILSSASGIPNFFDISMACTFRLSDLLNFTSFTSVYDAYKINSVKLELEYLNNMSSVNSTGLMPSFYHYWDQDDATVPNVISVQQKQGMKRRHFRGNNSLKCSGRPKLAITAASQAGNVASIIAKSQYIDCVHSDVLHYALKMVITDVYLPGTVAVTQAFRWNWTYNVSFRAPINTA